VNGNRLPSTRLSLRRRGNAQAPDLDHIVANCGPNFHHTFYLTSLDSVSLISLSLLAMVAYHLCFQERRLV
jgi:hypothetical protein